MSGPGILDDLTTQMSDFLGLPADLDLPKLWHVQLERKASESGWSARAQLERHYGSEVWAAIHDWHVATGAAVTVSEPSFASGEKPWRTVSVDVSCAGLKVTVWGHVAADNPIPAWALPEHAGCLDEQMRSVA